MNYQTYFKELGLQISTFLFHIKFMATFGQTNYLGDLTERHLRQFLPST